MLLLKLCISQRTHPFLQSILYIFYGYYYNETQSNILITVFSLQPELENDISTPAGILPSSAQPYPTKAS